MVSPRLPQLLGFLCLSSVLAVRGDYEPHLVTAPNNPVLEIGTNFTATCMIIGTEEVSADDLYWNLSKIVIPKEHYMKINRTALNVTIPITSEKAEWLFCRCKKKSNYVNLNKGRFIHGIRLNPGYRPKKPENLSCVALQEGEFISPNLNCEWEAAGRQTSEVPLTYTLFVRDILSNKTFNVSSNENRAQVNTGIAFSHFMQLDVWVKAHNKLGTEMSEHLEKYGNFFVKTNPPSNVTVISEENFPTSLLISWSHPIAEVYLKLIYQIRFCPSGSHIWTDVPQKDISKYMSSFRLQNLQPDTVYTVQIRCKHSENNSGYWSNWSANATERTSEDRPASKPDLWKIIVKSSTNEGQVQLLCKDPEFTNGRIIKFDVNIENQMGKAKNRSLDWESIPVNSSVEDNSSGQRSSTVLKTIYLADRQSVRVCVLAVNSVGASPEAFIILANSNEMPPVKELKVWPHEGQLWVEWKPRNNTPVSEYVIEWVNGGVIDWQRENKTTRRTPIKGDLKPFVCYNVSVYPIYSGRIGKQTSMEAFLEQGAPSVGPSVKLRGNPGHDSAELEWEEIPQESRRGFIMNYTISYRTGTQTNNITVPANTTSYTLKSLSHDTRYDVWIRASTIQGSANGSSHSFTTQKYGPGMIESVVVIVSIGVLLVFLLCLYKKDKIRENFWPQIPNPGESTIGNWSPDCSSKEETPKENCLSGISVLDVCDSKHGFEEDKASLSLKKDKYLSEEHSSGIGGSSCMSSPRQSVSDSDEGTDMADTSASTVQYSSVVAPRGYKGQTPSSQAQHCSFSRSESTQPLLDSEESPDMFVQDSRHFHRFPGSPCFTHDAEDQAGTDPDDFKQLEVDQKDLCSIEEDTEQMALPDRLTEVLPAATVSSYMPQLGGYRPQ